MISQPLARRAGIAIAATAALASPAHASAQGRECIVQQNSAESNYVAALVKPYNEGEAPYFVAVVILVPKAVTLSPGFSFADNAAIQARVNMAGGEITRLTFDADLSEFGRAVYMDLPYLYENGKWVKDARMTASLRWGGLTVDPLLASYLNDTGEKPIWNSGLDKLPAGYQNRIGNNLQIDLKADGITRATISFADPAIDMLRKEDNVIERQLRSRYASGECEATAF